MTGTNYNNSAFSKMTVNGSNGRVNEILMESQKLIYAPPSRDKQYKPSYRSPLIEKQGNN
jgi:hypothetical protein